MKADSFMPEDEQSLMNTSSRVALDTPQSITSKTPLHVWGWINTVVDQSQSKHRCPFNLSKHQAQSMDWQHPSHRSLEFDLLHRGEYCIHRGLLQLQLELLGASQSIHRPGRGGDALHRGVVGGSFDC